MGNICRSPAGEGLLKSLIVERQLTDKVLVDSAGTIGYHAGKPADSRMREAASRRGYDLTSRSRQVTSDDLQSFDLVVAMDVDNFTDLKALPGGTDAENIVMLSEYLDESWPRSVPDPYYGGEAGFEYVLDMIEAACPALLDALVQD